MRAYHVTIDPFEFTDLLRCDIYRAVNEHATARISGYIPREKEDLYMRMSFGDIEAAIRVQDDTGKEMVIFYGIVQNISINSTNSQKRLDLDLISASYLMDNREHTRTFQNAAMTYDSVLEQIGSTYDNYGVILTAGSENAIKDLIVQYRETDWEFAKRLASHFNSVLIPASFVKGTKYYFGLPGLQENTIYHTDEYTMSKSMGEYLNKTENEVGIGEYDALYCQVEEREIYELAQRVSFMGNELYVFEIRSEMKGNELVHQYALKTRNGFNTQKIYNAKITGTSLAGRIIEVKQDIVKVHVSVDEKQDNGTAKWFSYSTAYSSPDGTGWYCMPEINDSVRLYFPNEKETEGYVISATHLEAGEQDRSNPDHKSLKSKYGKEVLFTPNSMILTNNAGMYIEILDNEGINIVSNKRINIISDEAVAIVSTTSELQVVAPDEIVLEQSFTKVVLQDNVVMSGPQLVVQK